MPAISVYEHKDYKEFIVNWIAQAPHAGRGLRKDLAEAIGCQTPFITHVLNGDYQFSPEQSEACARWMGLSEDEIEFFVILVLRQRAATKPLEKMLSRQLTQRRQAHSVLKKRVKIQESLSESDQTTYYSTWQYAAAHLAVSNPTLQTIESLQSYLQIPTPRLLAILDFLISRGFVKREKGFYKSVQQYLHLEVGTPLIQQHHTNWRLKALDAIAAQDPRDLHYSGVISLSQEDYEWVRERLSTFLEEVSARVKNSSDEKLAGLTFDWFGI